MQTADQYYTNPSVTMVPGASNNPMFPVGTFSLNNVCDTYMMTYPLFDKATPLVQLGEAVVFKVSV